MVGIDSDLFATVADSAFKDECNAQSSCEAVLNRSKCDHTGTVMVDTCKVYLDSGAT